MGSSSSGPLQGNFRDLVIILHCKNVSFIIFVGIDKKVAVTQQETIVAKPTKSPSGLSSILENSNVDPAAAAATVLVGGGAAAFLTSLLGSFLPSWVKGKTHCLLDDGPPCVTH
mgnify:CR=1 FL=1